ncbi:type VI-B CRISPR-associated RNA-guided ribonuclease Cas13b [Saccharicrinis sp. FJH54]|uniref:type VI-B CRISPR-associated RNA-guided ribonuclease Cas13b n=1 Tax=Saccharicrinis sp. FJH54 TaxID=3344665 RepID=UPI0035D4B2BA
MTHPDQPQKENITLLTHPFYFAHYLNMAKHSVYLILSDISLELTGSNDAVLEENLTDIKILNQKFGKNKPDELAYRNQLLVKHFPFLRQGKNIEDKELYKDLPEKLKAAVKTLTDLRNSCSHYPFLEAYSAIDLKPYFDLAITKAENRMSGFFTSEDFFILKNDEKGWYKLNSDNEKFTLKGLCFFTCFFLEKKYAFQFLAGIKGFKDSRDHKFRATLETFTEHCCRLPYPKLESSDFKLDILNELSRCPQELFSILGEEDQKLFIAKTDEAGTEPDEGQQPIMKRHGDRFPYFALRYFDESKLLNDIHFHIQIGRWVKDEYQKNILVERERKILKEIRTFGELENYSAEKIPDYWTQHNISVDDFDPFYPKYRLVGNRIGISIGKKYNNWPLPGKNNPKPTAILSTYELPNIFLYGYLYRKGFLKTSPGDFIQEHLNKINTFIADVQSGNIKPVGDFTLEKKRDQGDNKELLKRKKILNEILLKKRISFNDLPDSVRYYLLGYKWKSNRKQTKEFLKKMLKESNRLIDRAEKIKIGDMAQQLARDIVFMSPPYDHKDKSGEMHKLKLNDQEYDFLQKSIAYFRSNKFNIDEFFKSHKLFISSKKHPFLYKINVLKCQVTSDFFIKYYRQKIKWLNEELEQFKNRRFNVDDFLDDYAYMIQLDKKTHEKNYEDGTPFLPRGFFNPPVIKALQNQGYDLKSSDNVSFAIKRMLNELSQTFYDKPRFYADKIKLQPQEIVSNLKAKQKTIDEESDEAKQLHYQIKDIYKSEKSILHQQFTDRVLWIMVKELLPEGIAINDGDLSKVGFDIKENNVLDIMYPMSETLFNEYIVTDMLPIKRYGEFRRFLKDRRLENLLKYFDNHVPIERDRLVKELEAYDLGRKQIFEKIYLFEKTVYSKFSSELEPTMHEGHEYVKHWEYLNFIKNKFKIEIPGEELIGDGLTEWRKRFMHNQIVFNEKIKNLIDLDSDILITNQILNLVGNIYDKMMETVQNTIN